MRNGPTECISTGNASGWMTEMAFLHFMKHFIFCLKPTKESPALLLSDNHNSHLSLPVLDLVKNNRVVMASHPSRCSDKLQPLGVSVFGLFKKYLASAQDAWMRNNPGKTTSIYDIAWIVRTLEALSLTLTPNNILNGVKKTKVSPFYRKVFENSDFTSSFVTDRPIHDNNQPPLSSVYAETQPVSAANKTVQP